MVATKGWKVATGDAPVTVTARKEAAAGVEEEATPGDAQLVQVVEEVLVVALARIGETVHGMDVQTLGRVTVSPGTSMH